MLQIEYCCADDFSQINFIVPGMCIPWSFRPMVKTVRLTQSLPISDHAQIHLCPEIW